MQGAPTLVNVKDPFRLPTLVVITAWFPALQCLSAFLVSCRCCGKHTTLYLFLLPQPPRCLLLKINFHITISGFLLITALIQSLWGIHLFLKISVWMLLSAHAKYVHMYKRDSVHCLKHLKKKKKSVWLLKIHFEK